MTLKPNHFKGSVTRRRRKDSSGKRGTLMYRPQDVDFFVIYCGGIEPNKFYVIPRKSLKNQTYVKLYPHRPKGFLSRASDWEIFRGAFSLLRKE